MNAVHRLRPAPLLVLALTVLLGGCHIDEEDLARWKHVHGGVDRLTGYLAESHRPLELRVRAARHLFEMGASGQVVLVVKQTPEAERGDLLEPLLLWLSTRFASAEPSEAPRAKDLLYALIPYCKDLPPGIVQPVVDNLMEWAIPQLFARQLTSGRPVEQVIIAAGLIWPAQVSEPILEALRTGADADRVPKLVRLITQFADPKVRLAVAAALLDLGKKSLPVLPEPVILALEADGNETLLRFLLDAARDPEIELATRSKCVLSAVKGMGEKAIPGLEDLLRSEDPLNHNDLRWAVLAELVRVRGPKGLDAALAALPEGSGWPDEADTMKTRIEQFCEASVQPDRDKMRRSLLLALDLPNATARTFAAVCVRALFPDEAAELLAPVRDDKTALRGFGREPPPTLGDLARGKLAP